MIKGKEKGGASNNRVKKTGIDREKKQ